MKKLEKWQAVTAVVVSLLVLGAAFKKPVYHAADIQTRSGTEALKKDLQANDDSLAYELSIVKQLQACEYWNVPYEKCKDFQIPVVLPRK